MRRQGKEPFNFLLQYDPADIPKLAAEYMATFAEADREMETAGRRIASGDFSRTNLEVIYRWKSARRIGLLANNTDSTIAQALQRATSARDVREAVLLLMRLEGVGVKMASAILTAIDPERYTVLDVRALEALGMENSEDIDLYVLYVEACREMARKYGVKMRDLDRRRILSKPPTTGPTTE